MLKMLKKDASSKQVKNTDLFSQIQKHIIQAEICLYKLTPRNCTNPTYKFSLHEIIKVLIYLNNVLVFQIQSFNVYTSQKGMYLELPSI